MVTKSDLLGDWPGTAASPSSSPQPRANVMHFYPVGMNRGQNKTLLHRLQKSDGDWTGGHDIGKTFETTGSSFLPSADW